MYDPQSSIVKNYDLSSVYFLQSGAAPVSAELTEQIARVLPNSIIGQGYGQSSHSGLESSAPLIVAIESGMTEMATAVTFLQLDQRVGTLGSGGVMLPGVVARVVRPDGSLAGLNELGELHVKTPSAALGYLGNPTACVRIPSPVLLTFTPLIPMSDSQDSRDFPRWVCALRFVSSGCTCVHYSS